MEENLANEAEEREEVPENEMEELPASAEDSGEERAVEERVGGTTTDSNDLEEREEGPVLEENPLNNGENEMEEMPALEASLARSSRGWFKPHYTSLSMISAVSLLWYTLRTRREFYPAMIYLSSSKLSYCVFGNAVAAAAFSVFHTACRVFLNGLRLAEREAIADGMRWSMTDTCLALTMFREEVSLNMGGMFLLLIMCKCWHWAVELRGKHLIQTEEAVTIDSTYGLIPYAHLKYLIFSLLLGIADVLGVIYCAVKCINDGPSVHIFFGFEAMILLISSATNIDLYLLHFFDGLINVANHKYPSFSLLHRIASLWRDSKLTLTLGVDLVAHAAKFLNYLFLFFIVFTYYGLPINIFREVYMASQDFRKKILLFAGYRRLTHLMDQKFHTLSTPSELDHAGHVCIICRDQMRIHESPKKLPGCGHVFHPYCLKGWLMQQQSCPTCRTDIMQAVKEQARLDSLHNLQRNQLPPDQTPAQPTQPEPHPLFPCLYKVNNAHGAQVFDSPASRTVIRTVPHGAVVLCTEINWWRPVSDTVGEMMLLIPDGWMRENDLVRILPLPIPFIQGVERDLVDVTS